MGKTGKVVKEKGFSEKHTISDLQEKHRKRMVIGSYHVPNRLV